MTTDELNIAKGKAICLALVPNIIVLVVFLAIGEGFGSWGVGLLLELLLMGFSAVIGYAGGGCFAALVALGMIGLAGHVTDGAGAALVAGVTVMAATGYLLGGYSDLLDDKAARAARVRREEAGRRAAEAERRIRDEFFASARARALEVRSRGLCHRCLQPAPMEATRCPHCTSVIEAV